MKPRRVIFEDKDAELAYRAARVGLKGLSPHERPRAELALKRLYNLWQNMRKGDSFILELQTENHVLKEKLSEFRNREMSESSLS